MWRKRTSVARESSAPSSWLAWQKWSARTRSWRPKSAGMIPMFAWYPELKTSALSVLLNAATSSSSSWWIERFPLIRRDAPAPTPYRSRASLAAATSAGWDESPR